MHFDSYLPCGQFGTCCSLCGTVLLKALEHLNPEFVVIRRRHRSEGSPRHSGSAAASIRQTPGRSRSAEVVRRSSTVQDSSHGRRSRSGTALHRHANIEDSSLATAALQQPVAEKPGSIPMRGKPPLTDRSRQRSVRTSSHPATTKSGLRVALRSLLPRAPSGRSLLKVVKRLNHVIHTVPNLVLRFAAALYCDVNAIPIVACSGSQGQVLSFLSAYMTTRAGTVPKRSWCGQEAATSTSSPCWSAIQNEFYSPAFLSTRINLCLLSSFIHENVLFKSVLVTRQLRSGSSAKRVTGWFFHITAHTLLDPFFLSMVAPIALMRASSNATSTPLTVNASLPGVARGLGLSFIAVLVEQWVSPALCRLVDRAAVTLLEAVEYVTQRRYEYVDISSASQSCTSESDVSVRSFADESVNTGRADSPGSARIAAKEEEYRQERRQRHQARRERQRKAQSRVQRVILRAILYRMLASMVAMCAVKHPAAVVIELLRSRSLLNVLGAADISREERPVSYPVNWKGLTAYVADTASLSQQESIPLAVRLLRNAVGAMGEEMTTLHRGVVDISGEREVIQQIWSRARDEGRTASDSLSVAWHSLRSISPLYRGVAVTLAAELLSFYMGTWQRLDL